MVGRARRLTSTSLSAISPRSISPSPAGSRAAPFAFADDFVRADGIRAMLCSTPQMPLTLALEAALHAFDGVRMADVQGKGRMLGDLMIALADERLGAHGVGVASLPCVVSLQSGRPALRIASE
jgi:kynureninase